VIAIIAACPVFCTHQAKGQTKPSIDLPKYEVSADFTSFSISSEQTHPGIGGRFTYNLNRHVALEAAGYFSPGKCASCAGEVTGRITEGLFGVKAGQRFKKWGIFGKARPGFISFSQGNFDLLPSGGGAFPFTIVTSRLTNSALDLGGVVEFYPSKRIVLRFDNGVTFNHYGPRTVHSVSVDPVTGSLTPATFTTSSFTRRIFQFIGGVGFRF